MMSRVNGRFTAVFASACLAAAAACSATRQQQSRQPQQCAGTSVLVVRNNSSSTYDVVATRGGTDAGSIIGTATPGVSNHPIPPGAGHYFTLRPSIQSGSTPPRSNSGPASSSMSVECR